METELRKLAGTRKYASRRLAVLLMLGNLVEAILDSRFIRSQPTFRVKRGRATDVLGQDRGRCIHVFSFGYPFGPVSGACAPQE